MTKYIIIFICTLNIMGCYTGRDFSQTDKQVIFLRYKQFYPDIPDFDKERFRYSSTNKHSFDVVFFPSNKGDKLRNEIDRNYYGNGFDFKGERLTRYYYYCKDFTTTFECSFDKKGDMKINFGHPISDYMEYGEDSVILFIPEIVCDSVEMFAPTIARESLLLKPSIYMPLMWNVVVPKDYDGNFKNHDTISFACYKFGELVKQFDYSISP